MLALMLVAGWSGAWAAEPAPAETIRTAQLNQSRVSAETASLEKQVASLQAQVAALQSQLNSLMAAVKVSESGVVLQGPSVTIQGGKIDVLTTGNLLMRVGDLESHITRNTMIRSGNNIDLLSATHTSLRAGGMMDIRGAMILLNNGSNPVATVQPGPGGQVVTGSQTVKAN